MPAARLVALLLALAFAVGAAAMILAEIRRRRRRRPVRMRVRIVDHGREEIIGDGAWSAPARRREPEPRGA
jgi:hypothetical protein